MGINGKILVFVDLPGGELDETGRGLLSYGARLARTLDSPWGAVVAARPDSAQLASFGAYGTPTITCLAGGEGLLDTPALLGKSLAGLAQDELASAIILLLNFAVRRYIVFPQKVSTDWKPQNPGSGAHGRS